MRLKQELIVKKGRITERVLREYDGFLKCVSGNVKKHGIEKVLSSERGDELFWLKKAYEKVCSFAQDVHLKQIPNKLEGTGEGGSFVVKVEIENENTLTSQSGNRISKYIEI